MEIVLLAAVCELSADLTQFKCVCVCFLELISSFASPMHELKLLWFYATGRTGIHHYDMFWQILKKKSTSATCADGNVVLFNEIMLNGSSTPFCLYVQAARKGFIQPVKWVNIAPLFHLAVLCMNLQWGGALLFSCCWIMCNIKWLKKLVYWSGPLSNQFTFFLTLAQPQCSQFNMFF